MMPEIPANPPVEAEDDNYDDADSAVGASIASSTTSINSSILAYREENGRTYHAYKDGVYAFPNDEGENNRLDMQHHLFALTLHGKLYLSPLDEKKLHRVLDLGTGTGIWAIDFADMHGQSEVLGVDLSPIQPSFVPPNLRFEVDDIESDWNYNQKFDFIYARQMTGSIENWPKLFKQSFENLNPGGYFEIFDNIHPPRCDDGTMPDDWPVKKWSELLLKTLKEKMNRSLESALDYESQLKEAGFVNVVVKEYMWPICRWPKDKHLKELGLWASEQVSGGAEGLSQAVCCRMCGWSAEELQVFLVSIRKELRNTKVHAYWPLIVCYAQKPLDSTSS